MDDLPLRAQHQVPDYVTCLAVDPTGAAAWVGDGGGSLTRIDLRGGGLRTFAAVHAEGLFAVDATAEHVITGGGDGEVRVLDASNPEARVSLPRAGRGWVEHVAFAPGGRTFAVANGKTLRFATVAGQTVHTIDAAPSAITGIAWNRAGKELAVAAYGGLRTYWASSGERAKYLAWKGSLISIAWSANDEVIAGGTQECAVHFWRLGSMKDSEMAGYPQKPKSLAFDASGTLLATSGANEACVWSFAGKGPEGTSPTLLRGHGDAVSVVRFHPKKGLLATGSKDGTVFVWEPKRGERPLAFSSLPAAITVLAWTVSGQLIVGDAEGHLALHDPL